MLKNGIDQKIFDDLEPKLQAFGFKHFLQKNWKIKKSLIENKKNTPPQILGTLEKSSS